MLASGAIPETDLCVHVIVGVGKFHYQSDTVSKHHNYSVTDMAVEVHFLSMVVVI